MAGVGVPVKLLHEAQGLIVSVELRTGQTYRGKLHEAEDNMNMQLREVTLTARDGRVSQMDQCFIRGSHVRYIIVPDNLRNAPFFQRFGQNVTRARGLGVGGRGRGAGTAFVRGSYLCKQRRGYYQSYLLLNLARGGGGRGRGPR